MCIESVAANGYTTKYEHMFASGEWHVNENNLAETQHATKVRFVDQVKQKIHKVNTVIGPDGKEYKVSVIYGKEDWRTIFAQVIRNHYLD
jgi:iron only hydrogenase large subunit-like protein